MRKAFLTMAALLICSTALFAEILYSVQEYALKGRNYSIRTHPVLYLHMSGFGSKEIIWIYFTKAGGQYKLTMLAASKALEQKLPLVVLKFIGNKITAPKLMESKSELAAKEETRKAIEKALDKTWLNSLTNDSESFANHHEYDRDYAGFDMNYYEFFPIEEKEFSNPTSLEDKLVLKPFFDDKNLATESILLKSIDQMVKVEDAKLKKPDFDKNISWQEYRYNNLMYVIQKLGSVNYHHKDLKVSDWPLASNKNWVLFETAPTGFHSEVDSTCKYMMELQPTLKTNEYMPAMAWRQNYGDWKATRCNIFVYDFAKKGLGLTTGPWIDRNTDANKLYLQLPSNGDFVKISWREAWLYASIGYPVMISTPQIGPAAHIGFAYPIDLSLALETSKLEDGAALTKMRKSLVVQAGATIGKVIAEEGFSALADANIYVYLGYLAK